MQHSSLKQIVFIASREPSYSRVALMRSCLSEHYEVREILSTHRRYLPRLCSVVLRLLQMWFSGRLGTCDALVLGFFAQPIFPLVRWLYRGPIISDAYFSMFDTVVNDKQFASPTSLKGRLCRWLDSYMLRRSESCLTDTACHAEYFRSEFQQPQANIERWWISAECQPLPRQPALPPAGQAFEVFFWGGFIPLQGVPSIVRAANLLKSQNIHFTVYGCGQTLDQCVRLKQELDAHNIDFLGWKSADEIRAQAQRSHLALGIFGTTDKAGRVIPNKVFEALAMGIPLITRDSRAAQELLTDGYDALLVPPADPEKLAEKILWVREHYNAACQVSQQGLRTFFRRAAPQQISQQLHEHVEKVISQFVVARQRAATRLFTAGQSEN